MTALTEWYPVPLLHPWDDVTLPSRKAKEARRAQREMAARNLARDSRPFIGWELRVQQANLWRIEMKILTKLLCKHPNRHYLPRSEVTDKACMKCDTCGKEWKFKP